MDSQKILNKDFCGIHKKFHISKSSFQFPNFDQKKFFSWLKKYVKCLSNNQNKIPLFLAGFFLKKKNIKIQENVFPSFFSKVAIESELLRP